MDMPKGLNLKTKHLSTCVRPLEKMTVRPAYLFRLGAALGPLTKWLRRLPRRKLELYSASGDYDLLMKLYVPDGEDIGRYINENLHDLPDLERTYTIQTFNAF